MHMKQPLVSFCVMCHNQEAYIEEAFRAALAQTYEPLEVIVNDDASTDGSWGVIQRIAAEYAGPHKVILNRCETNRNIIRSFETLCSLSSGELIVKADGDDVSYPNRAQALVDEWLKTDKKALCLVSDFDVIDNDGNLIAEKQSRLGFYGRDARSFKDIVFEKGGAHLGAAMAVSPVLYHAFPLAVQTKGFDDRIFALRACFLSEHVDRIRVLPQSLVKYRRDSGVTCVDRVWMSRSVDGHKQAYLDCQAIGGQETKLPLIQRKIEWDEAYFTLRFGASWFSKLKACLTMWKHPKSFKLMIRRSGYLLPSCIRRLLGRE